MREKTDAVLVCTRPARDVASPPGGALFRALLAAGMDAAAAYTVVREMESTAGHNVVVQLGAQIQALASEVRSDLQDVRSDLREVKSGLAEVKTDVAVLKKEVRLVWGTLSLLVVTLTAIFIRLFAA